MIGSAVYAFEEIGGDFARPPMAALRALLASGIVLSPQGWIGLPIESRSALAIEGTRDDVNIASVRALLRGISLAEVKMVGGPRSIDPHEPPPELKRALHGARLVSSEEWRALRALDRFVLCALAANSRVYGRALDEILVRAGRPGAGSAAWVGPVAHVELRVDAAAIDRLDARDFMEGRAYVLARVAGVRSARQYPEIFDRHGAGIGIVEVDASPRRDAEIVLWQAHVSTWNGEFAAGAALAAATSAAIAIFDAVRGACPRAAIVSAGIREEAWQVGNPLFADDATVFGGM
jgi:molybdenum cofactor biosynthesis enzyme